MAVTAAYSRHKMLEEIKSPLYSPTVGGNTYFLTPAEQQAQVLANMTNDISAATQLAFMDAMTDTLTDAAKLTILSNLVDQTSAPAGWTVTTGATTAISAQQFNGIDQTVTLTLTGFSLGTAGDGAALGIGASLITLPSGTLVQNATAVGTFSVVGNDYTNAMDWGLGTTIASGAVSVLGGTAAFESILGGQTSGSLAASGANSVIAVDGPDSDFTGKMCRMAATTPGLVVFMNAAATWTNVATAGALTFTGTVTFKTRQT